MESILQSDPICPPAWPTCCRSRPSVVRRRDHHHQGGTLDLELLSLSLTHPNTPVVLCRHRKQLQQLGITAVSPSVCACSERGLVSAAAVRSTPRPRGLLAHAQPGVEEASSQTRSGCVHAFTLYIVRSILILVSFSLLLPSCSRIHRA